MLQYILISSASQAVAHVAMRVKLGGHAVPEYDIRRCFDRSRKHFSEDYLPPADEWGCGRIILHLRFKSQTVRRTPSKN